MENFDISEGVKLYNDGQFAEALMFFLNVAEAQTPEEATELSYYKGLSAIKLENYDVAIEALEQVVTTCEDAEKINQCRLLLSVAYAKTNRTQLAEAELNFLKRSESKNTAELFNALGFIAFEKGEVKNAIDYYEKVLAEDPENTTAMNGLGYILADSDIDVSRALVLCKQACEAKPDYPPYLDSLAWVCHKLKLSNKAKDLITKAKKMLPENKFVQKHYDEIFNS